jgi:alpha,alpha-trehalase
MKPADCNADHRRAKAASCPPADPQTPADRYQELFIAVQKGRIFADSKVFVDCAPRGEPQAILAAYRAERDVNGFDLRDFVHRHFVPTHAEPSGYVSEPGRALSAHIDALWPVLTREPMAHPPNCSLLPLPHDYIVPGGRFVEMYYWDSYFTMVGLIESGCSTLLHAMTDNFAYLIDRFGHVPNGNRTYYLSRSQPPVFAAMVELCESCGGRPAIEYLPQLLREHAWLMDGAAELKPGEAHRRVVALAGEADAETVWLNRYWDDRDTPREEAWSEDVATAAKSGRPAAEVYRDLRAACESGWDFSTRWLKSAGSEDARGSRLEQICTTQILPVDLNAWMHKLETTIARLAGQSGDAEVARRFGEMAERRNQAIDRLMWDESQGAYFDYDWQQRIRRTCLTAAAIAPLFVGLATARQAAQLADTVRRRLLAPGGLATTERGSDQQWDRPNGWAPLQWMAVMGFERYGQRAIARHIRTRWLKTVAAVYEREGRLVEKYVLRAVPADSAAGGQGGEYPLQDGFGWTNGVARRWLYEVPRFDVRAVQASL